MKAVVVSVVEFKVDDEVEEKTTVPSVFVIFFVTFPVGRIVVVSVSSVVFVPADESVVTAIVVISGLDDFVVTVVVISASVIVTVPSVGTVTVVSLIGTVMISEVVEGA